MPCTSKDMELKRCRWALQATIVVVLLVKVVPVPVPVPVQVLVEVVVEVEEVVVVVVVVVAGVVVAVVVVVVVVVVVALREVEKTSKRSVCFKVEYHPVIDNLLHQLRFHLYADELFISLLNSLCLENNSRQQGSYIAKLTSWMFTKQVIHNNYWIRKNVA